MRLNGRKPQPLNLSIALEDDTGRASASGKAQAEEAPSGRAPPEDVLLEDAPSEDAQSGAARLHDLPELPRVARLGPSFPPPSGARPGVSAGTARPPKGAGGVAGPQAYVIACVAAALWVGCFIAFIMGFQGRVAPLTYAPFASVILAVLTVLPAGAMILAAYAVRQAARLAAETREAHRLADGLALPATLAVAKTGELMTAVREEVERASAGAASAQDRLAALQEALAAQSQRLGDIASASEHAAHLVGETLERERERTAALAQLLHERAAEIGHAVEGQTRLVAEASDLASSQLQEAEATLAARAAGVTNAAAAAGLAAQEAGERLTAQTKVLDAAGAALLERMESFGGRLAEHYGAMTSLLDQSSQADDDAAVRLETRRAQLIEVIAQARVGEAELGDASTHGAALLQGLIATASDQVRELAAAVQAEQEALSQRALEARGDAQADLDRAIATLGETAEAALQRILAQAEDIRRAADAHVEAAKGQVEQLGEVAYEAGQRSNQAFDARVNEARRLIEQAGTVVEEAGQRSAARMEAGLRETDQAVERLTAALADMDARMASLPEQTRARVEAMRAATDRGVVELSEAMRRLSEEAQSIDAAFQERVRRNSQALQDTPRKAADAPGAVTPFAPPSPPAPARGAPTTAAATKPAVEEQAPSDPAEINDDFIAPEVLFQRDAYPRPQPTTRANAGAKDRKPAFAGRSPPPQVFGRANTRGENDAAGSVDPSQAQSARQPDEHQADDVSGVPAVEAGAGGDNAIFSGAAAESDRLRPRLRLTPTEADRMLKTVFDPLQGGERNGKPAPAGDGAGADRPPAGRAWEQDLDEWTWKDLLSSIEEAPSGEDRLAEQMIGEIAALGVDAAALLPRPRVEEIAASVRAGDPLAARESVRRLAPAAVRRLSRRVLVDKALREQADRYVRHYEGLLRGTAGDDDDGASTLLSSDPGRAYLLLDAAVGDLQ